MPTTRSAAPIFAAFLLLLPVLYSGSYFALVAPEREGFTHHGATYPYRYGGALAASVYWPLEQIDRRLRAQV
ncbi:hypothetical protein ETAA8_07630 [Anatilimnocola aggregata]|uniref:Uncharacterized protein n=1 Tax=Anatilimnocola aggregata TaxID=2528021 RepID=A0A517Y635_9BACT|nr:hypothetical protein [Anatilimnocola aggregata]QDU25693.1 hypothetical protein ETAA8_07630 [Anatilimnocola aggregata]